MHPKERPIRTRRAAGSQEATRQLVFSLKATCKYNIKITSVNLCTIPAVRAAGVRGLLPGRRAALQSGGPCSMADGLGVISRCGNGHATPGRALSAEEAAKRGKNVAGSFVH